MIDDDPAVHVGTRYALASYTLDGRGLEIALAANHRIAVDDRSVKIGLPEFKLTLLGTTLSLEEDSP